MAKKSTTPKTTNSSIEDTISQIQTKFGEGAIIKLGDAPRVDVKAIPTGSIGLDYALGIGGIPRGRIVEIFGPESSGKTTLALHVVASAQKEGGIAAFVDAEHALDPEYSKNLGVNINELLVSQPDNGEQALEITESLVRSGKVDIIVVDSVAALTPKDEIEGDMGAHHVGKQARLMSQALRKLTAIVAKSKTTVIFINQIRMQIGVMFGNPETTPGGKALKFYTSVRLDVRRIAQIKKGDEVVGGRVRVKVVKNKVASPFKQTEFDLMYNEGISKEGEIIALGEKFGLIEKKGSTYSYGEEKMGVGYDKARTFLKENKKIANEIVKKIKERKFIVVDGEPYEVLSSHVFRKQMRKPVNQTKLRNLISGKVIERAFHQAEKVDEADIERKKIKYLYSNKGEFCFCEEKDPSKRFNLSEEIIVGAKFMKENSLVDVKLFNEEIIGVSIPIKVELKVKEAPPAVKGNTATGANKQVVLETGATIGVPIFVKEGDVIEVNTETGEYSGRV